MDTVLERIHADVVNVDNDADTKMLVAHQKWLVERLFEDMKRTNGDFQRVSAGIYWTGSYYEGTRVVRANEFDVNFVLRLEKGMMGVDLDGLPSMVRLRVHSSQYSTPVLQWLFSKNMLTGSYLRPNGIRSWMESLVERSLLMLQTEFFINGCTVTTTKAGPAITLHVVLRIGLKYDVDVVPVILVEESLVQSRWHMRVPCGAWYAVPKPRSVNSEDDLYWRISFPKQEKQLLVSRHRLLPTYRLMKKLRDKQQWSMIKSYYIKTIFLWEVQEQSAIFWESPLNVLFMHMLQVLHNRLCHSTIPNFWDIRCNLLDSHPTSLESIKIRLQSIIEHLQREAPYNPEVVRQYLV